MKRFSCHCGQRIYFENSFCLICNSSLGYDPVLAEMITLEPVENSLWRGKGDASENTKKYRFCRNNIDYKICNWMVEADSDHIFCLSCRLNSLIPNLDGEHSLKNWAIAENSKRWLLYSLLQIGLPVVSRFEHPDGISFAFMEDKRSNPAMAAEHVYTGHAHGLITINLMEANELKREQQRLSIGESYRTLLGHFRHESGHYYYDRLIRDSPNLQGFRELFGDERKDYQTALDYYHNNLARISHSDQFISIYAQLHPYEDWAETWAHYLHITDVLETAVSYNMLEPHIQQLEFPERVKCWIEFVIGFNALNRSMGHNDAYPFYVTEMVSRKLEFIHRVVSEYNTNKGFQTSKISSNFTHPPWTTDKINGSGTQAPR